MALISSIRLMARFFSIEGDSAMSAKVNVLFMFLKPMESSRCYNGQDCDRKTVDSQLILI